MRTMAFWPPSVIHAALSGPWMTPCGAELPPKAMSSVRPPFGSNQPRWPLRWAVNHTPPSGAGATSWMPVGRGVCSGHDCRRGAASSVAANAEAAPAPTAINTSRRVKVCMAGLLACSAARQRKPRSPGDVKQGVSCPPRMRNTSHALARMFQHDDLTSDHGTPAGTDAADRELAGLVAGEQLRVIFAPSTGGPGIATLFPLFLAQPVARHVPRGLLPGLVGPQ